MYEHNSSDLHRQLDTLRRKAEANSKEDVAEAKLEIIEETVQTRAMEFLQEMMNGADPMLQTSKGVSSYDNLVT